MNRSKSSKKVFRTRLWVTALLVGIVGATTLCVTEPVQAAVVRTGTVVEVTGTSRVPGDFYAMGNDVHVSGTIDGDLYVFGGTITIDGEVKGDVVAVGGMVTVHGKVDDDLRILAGKTVVANAVAGDIVGAGGVLSVLSEASVKGDVVFYLGRSDIAGPVSGRVFARGDSLDIDAPVGGVDATLDGQLSLGNNAKVTGDVHYTSAGSLARDPGASVSGTISRRSVATTERPTLSTIIVAFGFSVLFAALCGVALFRRNLERAVNVTAPHLGQCGFIGLAVLFITPVIAFLMGITIVGLMAVAVLATAYALLILASFITAHILVGAYLSLAVTKKFHVDWLWTIVGTIATQAVLLIPFVGFLVVWALMIIALGVIVRSLYSAMRTS